MAPTLESFFVGKEEEIAKQVGKASRRRVASGRKNKTVRTALARKERSDGIA